MEAVATTGLYPQTNQRHVEDEVDPKYGLMQLAVHTGSPRAPINGPGCSQADQQLYRRMNNARSTPYRQIMSYGCATYPPETPVIKRDELGISM